MILPPPLRPPAELDEYSDAVSGYDRVTLALSTHSAGLNKYIPAHATSS